MITQRFPSKSNQSICQQVFIKHLPHVSLGGLGVTEKLTQGPARTAGLMKPGNDLCGLSSSRRLDSVSSYGGGRISRGLVPLFSQSLLMSHWSKQYSWSSPESIQGHGYWRLDSLDEGESLK